MDYLVGWQLPQGAGPWRTMRVKMTGEEAERTDRALSALVDDREIWGYFIEIIPAKSASFEQFVGRVGDRLAHALEFGT